MTLKPDIITDTLIVDTKYKKLNSISDIRQSDKYQMYAYGKCYQKDAMLLYLKYSENIAVDLRINDVNLGVRTIDLDFDGEYDAYIIDKIKSNIQTIGARDADT